MRTYFNDFSTAEDPASDGGRLIRLNTDTKTAIKFASGHALGKATGNAPAFDDSYFLLLGFGDSEIITKVFRDPALSDADGNSYEIEHIHRGQEVISGGVRFTLGYEVDMFFHNGSPAIARWTTANPPFTDVSGGLVTDTAGWPDGANGQLRQDYLIKTRIVLKNGNQRIEIYCDSGSGFVLYFHYDLGSDPGDRPFLTYGDPGVGIFTPTSTSDPTLFGLDDISIKNFEVGDYAAIPKPMIAARYQGVQA